MNFVFAIGIFSLIGGAIFALRRRATPAEKAAIGALSDHLEELAGKTRYFLHQLAEKTDLAYHINQSHEEIEDFIKERKEFIRQELPEKVDGSFYGAAVKSLAPKKSWKQAFQAQQEGIQSELLDPDALESGLKAIIERQAYRMQSDLRSEIEAFSVELGAIRLDEKYATELQKLQKRPVRFKRLLGNDPKLQKLAGKHLKEGLQLGMLSLIHHVVVDKLIEWMGPELFMKALSPLLYAFIQTEVGKQVVENLVQWLAAEGAEQVMGEIVEGIAAIVTGVGIFFTAWKMFKYGRLVKRIWIDQEPLHQIRDQIQSSLFEGLDELEELAKEEASRAMNLVNRQLQESLTALDGQYAEMIQSARKRKKWAKAA